jgi:hypothetical protein
MSDSKPANGPSWWQTLPGILTGLAAIITAVTGLIVAFNRTGGRSEPAAPASSSSPPSLSREATIPAAASPESPTSGAIALPPLHEVKLAGGATVVTILSAQVAPIDAARRTLTFDVRHMNAGRYPANFWGNSYRLIVDGVPREPTNSLNEVVGPDSAKEGEVVFELPRGAKDVTLQITSGDDKTRLPFKLP